MLMSVLVLDTVADVETHVDADCDGDGDPPITAGTIAAVHPDPVSPLLHPGLPPLQLPALGGREALAGGCSVV